jgi:queuine/archaeosine tRNA-ribosyltransferase
LLSAQELYNAKKERICAGCLQKDFDATAADLARAFDELFKMKASKDSIAEELQRTQKKARQLKIDNARMMRRAK